MDLNYLPPLNIKTEFNVEYTNIAPGLMAGLGPLYNNAQENILEQTRISVVNANVAAQQNAKNAPNIEYQLLVTTNKQTSTADSIAAIPAIMAANYANYANSITADNAAASAAAASVVTALVSAAGLAAVRTEFALTAAVNAQDAATSAVSGTTPYIKSSTNIAANAAINLSTPLMAASQIAINKAVTQALNLSKSLAVVSTVRTVVKVVADTITHCYDSIINTDIYTTQYGTQNASVTAAISIANAALNVLSAIPNESVPIDTSGNSVQLALNVCLNLKTSLTVTADTTYLKKISDQNNLDAIRNSAKLLNNYSASFLSLEKSLVEVATASANVAKLARVSADDASKVLNSLTEAIAALVADNSNNAAGMASVINAITSVTSFFNPINTVISNSSAADAYPIIRKTNNTAMGNSASALAAAESASTALINLTNIYNATLQAKNATITAVSAVASAVSSSNAAINVSSGSYPADALAANAAILAAQSAVVNASRLTASAASISKSVSDILRGAAFLTNKTAQKGVSDLHIATATAAAFRNGAIYTSKAANANRLSESLPVQSKMPIENPFRARSRVTVPQLSTAVKNAVAIQRGVAARQNMLYGIPKGII